jgi:hypothetical protein
MIAREENPFEGKVQRLGGIKGENYCIRSGSVKEAGGKKAGVFDMTSGGQ